MSNAFVAPHFQTPEAAREWLENLRWPEGPICSPLRHDQPRLQDQEAGLVSLRRKGMPQGLSRSPPARVMERSHIPLNKWLMAFYLMTASKKGMSAHQLHRALGLDYKSAWFMCHRIREAMRDWRPWPARRRRQDRRGRRNLFRPGREGQAPSPRRRKGRPFTKGGKSGPSNKRAIVALVERGGNVRTFHVAGCRQGDGDARSCARTSPASRGCTPTKAGSIRTSAQTFRGARDGQAHALANTSAMRTASRPHQFSGRLFLDLQARHEGVYQHCKEKHLHRYLAEFDYPLQSPRRARLRRH